MAQRSPDLLKTNLAESEDPIAVRYCTNRMFDAPTFYSSARKAVRKVIKWGSLRVWCARTAHQAHTWIRERKTLAVRAACSRVAPASFSSAGKPIAAAER